MSNVKPLTVPPSEDVMHWTPTAVECYKRGCNCQGCMYAQMFKVVDYQYNYYQKCQVKRVVFHLLKRGQKCQQK